MTTEDLRGALGRALQAEGQRYAYVSDLWPYQDKFVYSAEGGSFCRSFAVAEDGTITLGGDSTAVQSKVVWEPVTLATFSAGADYVEWEGELFRARSYPDKGVEAPPELFRQWIADWSPAKLKVEHINTPLDKVFEGSGVPFALGSFWAATVSRENPEGKPGKNLSAAPTDLTIETEGSHALSSLYGLCSTASSS